MDKLLNSNRRSPQRQFSEFRTGHAGLDTLADTATRVIAINELLVKRLKKRRP